MKISVIVCTYNRSYAIGACLDSIAQSLAAAAPIEAEIVVVDNASTDDTAAVIKKLAETNAFPVQALYEPKKGLSAARNCGMRAARGELLVFTDDDCRLSKDYVIDALRHDAADTEPVFRGGRVELGDPTDLPLTIKRSPDIARLHKTKYPVTLGEIIGVIIGCNMVVRRAVALKIGFFDEDMGAGTTIAGGEDIDYIFRAYLDDILLEYVPDMAVFHYHGRKHVADTKKLLRGYANGIGALYAKYLFSHPRYCRQFYWDFKAAVREFISGKNNFSPEIDFWLRDWVLYCAIGALKYYIILVRKKIS